MTYSPECVAAFEARFKPNPRLIEFSAVQRRYIGIQEKPSDPMDLHDLLAMGFTAQLVGFAANWERARELEYVLGQIVSDLPSNKDWLDPAIEQAARKLLEKGNE